MKKLPPLLILGLLALSARGTNRMTNSSALARGITDATGHQTMFPAYSNRWNGSRCHRAGDKP